MRRRKRHRPPQGRGAGRRRHPQPRPRCEIGAANTLSFDGDEIRADNTDAGGITGAIGDPVDGKRALVLGAGGSARAAVYALRNAGAVVSDLEPNDGEGRIPGRGVRRGGRTTNDERQQLDPSPFDLLLNATTLGLGRASAGPPTSADLKPFPFSADSLSERQVVVDLVYGPHETALVTEARRRGARVIDGLEVLVHQGAASLRIWTGLEPPLETMRAAARES